MWKNLIDHERLKELSNCKVLIRAHGEPPSTYEIALKNNIELLDASCPVVLKLQHQIKEGYETIKDIEGQILLFGKEGHAEVTLQIGVSVVCMIPVQYMQDARARPTTMS